MTSSQGSSKSRAQDEQFCISKADSLRSTQVLRRSEESHPKGNVNDSGTADRTTVNLRCVVSFMCPVQSARVCLSSRYSWTVL
jgi:hypothetical protein